MYNLRDIGLSLSGDIELSANGDLKLGDAYESIKSAVNYLARTDKGEYKPDIRIGGDTGRAIGENMDQESLRQIERSIRENLNDFLLNSQDFQVHAIPVEDDVVGVFIAIGGQYLDDDGNILDTDPEVISFAFPFNGDPTPTAE